MTIKEIADACEITPKIIIDACDDPNAIDYYTESDVEKMLRYVAMEVAKMMYDGSMPNKECPRIVNQILGEG